MQQTVSKIRARATRRIGVSRRLAEWVLGALVLSWNGAGAAAPATEPHRPNIVFILADDLGWSDVGCYGGVFAETPRLDQLAREGIRFTEAYAPAPICSASRAAILTGRSPARLKFEFVTKHPGDVPAARALCPPPYTLDLPLEEVTVAEQLAAAGYETVFCGKWHVSQHHGGYLGWSPTCGPRQQGFEIAQDTFGSHTYAKRPGSDDTQRLPAGEYPRDSLTEAAIAFLQGPHHRPFLLYVSHYYVHTPVRAPTEWLAEKYRAKADGQRDPRQIEYAAFVQTFDHYVGQLLDALDRAGLADSTLVVFTSDNGGHPEYSANAPLRGSKWNLYEGGIRVPLIVRWPGHAAPGTTCAEPVIGTDVLPTFCDLGNIAPPERALDGCSLVPLLEGATFKLPRRPLVWHFPYYHPEVGYDRAPGVIGINDFVTSQTRPHSAIRSGMHKLIHFYETDRDELYDLARDPGEQHDLAAIEPELAGQLRRRLDEYLQTAEARLPLPTEK